MSDKPRILIVGQGVAGTVLHYTLFQKNIFAEIIGTKLPGNASSAAAGIINPVTGPKYQLSWRFEELMEVFIPFYKSLEETLDKKFFHKMRMFRYLPGLEQINKWIRRWDDVSDAKYYGEFHKHMEGYPDFEGNGSWAEIYNAYRVDLNLLINSYAEFLIENNLFNDQLFDFNALKFEGNYPEYKGKTYDFIIFCEGHKVNNNPYFKYLPVIPAKGEVLIIKSNVPPDFMSKRNELITQWDDSNVWYGATLQNEFEDHLPNEALKNILIEKYVNDFNEMPKITDHLSGLRPTVKDRKPLIGRHPLHNKLAVFNGLGTKGTSLAPLMANYLVDHLIAGAEIPEEVNANRYENLRVEEIGGCSEA